MEEKVGLSSSLLTILPSASNQWNLRAYASAGVNFYVVPEGDGREATRLNRHQIEPLTVRRVAYHRLTQRMASYQSALHQEFDFISNSSIRHLAMTNGEVPSNFMPTEAWQVLLDHYRPHRFDSE